jgi:hypothetical protein
MLCAQWCVPFERSGHAGVSAALEATDNLAPETQPGQAVSDILNCFVDTLSVCVDVGYQIVVQMMRHQVKERVCPSSATPESHAFSQQLRKHWDEGTEDASLQDGSLTGMCSCGLMGLVSWLTPHGRDSDWTNTPNRGAKARRGEPDGTLPITWWSVASLVPD